MINLPLSASRGNWGSQKNKLNDLRRKSDLTQRSLMSRKRTIREITPKYVPSPTFYFVWIMFGLSPVSSCLKSLVPLFSWNRSNSWRRPTNSCSSAGRRASKLTSRYVPVGPHQRRPVFRRCLQRPADCVSPQATVFLDEAKLQENARRVQQKCLERDYAVLKEQNNEVRGHETWYPWGPQFCNWFCLICLSKNNFVWLDVAFKRSVKVEYGSYIYFLVSHSSRHPWKAGRTNTRTWASGSNFTRSPRRSWKTRSLWKITMWRSVLNTLCYTLCPWF